MGKVMYNCQQTAAIKLHFLCKVSYQYYALVHLFIVFYMHGYWNINYYFLCQSLPNHSVKTAVVSVT